jgi:uncharacterized protein
MGDKLRFIPLYERSALFQLFFSLLIVLCAGLILFSVFLLSGTIIFNTNLALLENPSSVAGKDGIGFIKYILISQDISFFIVPAIILLIKLKKPDQQGIFNVKIPPADELILVVLLSFCLFPITAFTGQINSGMNLPDWLSGIEQWMKEKEDNADNLLDVIISQGNFGVIVLNLLIMSVLPAIGEELIFRGVFQKILSKLFRSGQVAVWITAFVFSAIHFQFFGFLPRFILGLVFGYLFLWSGNLFLPILAHFVNNAVPTIGSSIQNLDKITSVADLTIWKQIILLPLPVLISIMILLYFRNKESEKLSG